jgi:hypothetical protein
MGVGEDGQIIWTVLRAGGSCLRPLVPVPLSPHSWAPPFHFQLLPRCRAPHVNKESCVRFFKNELLICKRLYCQPGRNCHLFIFQSRIKQLPQTLIRVGLDESLPPGKFHNRSTLGACHLHHLEASRNFIHSSRNVVTLLHNHSRIKRRGRCTTAIPHNPRIHWSTHSPSKRCLPSSMIRSLILHRVSICATVLPTRMRTWTASQSVWQVRLDLSPQTLTPELIT